MAIDAALVDELLQGEPGWRFLEDVPSGGIVNEHAIVERRDGRRAVVRRYRWPFGGVETFDRAAKETWLLPRLQQAGVPVPEVLGSVSAPEGRALLLTWLPGRLLGEWARDVSHDDLRAAWHVAGEALGRCHRADLGVRLGVGGLLVAGGVDEWREGGWGAWHVANTATHAARVLDRAREGIATRVTIKDCVELVEAARAHLDARPVRPIHADAHAWNVLVDRNGDANGWQCTGWLDWEFAWAADPRYDVMRARNAHAADVGATPPDFEEGLGVGADRLADAIYDLGFWLWMAGDDLDGVHHIPLTQARAWRWLDDLADHLREIGRMLEGMG